MNPSSPANRSFLHGNQKVPVSSEKVLYATLDCLALKRTRLPLQLAPADSNASDKSDKIDNELKSTNRKLSSRRPSFKVRPGASLHWKQRHRVNLVTGKFEHTQKESAIRQGSSSKTGNLSRQPYKNGTKTIPELLNMLLETKMSSNEQTDTSRSEKNIGHRRKINDNTGSRKQKETCPTNSGTTKVTRRSNNGNRNETDDLEIINNVSESETDCNIAKNYVKSTSIKPSENNNVIDFKQLKKQTKKLKKNKSGTSGLVKYDYPTNCAASKLKSLSRDELRYLTISEPTNFVHVASATHPNLISNETSSCSTPVIKHDEKCATLPLIRVNDEKKKCVGVETKDCWRLNEENLGSTANTHKYVPMQPVKIEADSVHRSKLNTEFSTEIDDVNMPYKKPLSRLCTYESVQANFHSCGAEEIPLDLNKDQNSAIVTSNRNEVEEKIYEIIREPPYRPKPNASFLWSNQQLKYSKSLINLKNETVDEYVAHLSGIEYPPIIRNNADSEDDDYELYEEYDDIRPSKDSVTTDEYDDVGPLPNLPTNAVRTTDDDVYDDVMPPKYTTVSESNREDDYFLPNSLNQYTSVTQSKSPISYREITSTGVDFENARLNEENQYLSVNNEYSSLEEISVDSDVYDDVGLPSQERVNSLYAGFDSGYLVGMSPREESEWEDLDETPPPPPPLPVPQRNITCAKGGDVPSTPSKKKLGETWSHKVRRQRSKASRENSAKSSNQNTRNHTSADSDSDNSNYETLCSSHPDDFSSESENEKDDILAGTTSPKQDETYAEAPSRPTPPPPREASLTQTLGRRMKLLRRTWSLTKGSLGRIGKKSSGDNDIYNSSQQQLPANTIDHKKYFSFKKHFRKNLTGLSTFYLENNEHGANKICNDAKEQIYSNTMWFNDESKIWHDDSVTIQNTQIDPGGLLTEEPLYQFYAAAAARTAFDSDSDGYEEVEDLISTRVTTDLTKPGQRTLWCQTPQVINSGLLQKLTAEERKLQEAKFEILTSETSYLSSLRVLEEEFIRNFDLNPGIITVAERSKLFGGVSDIRVASEKLLVDLERAWTDNPMLHGLPEILKRHAEKCSSIYVQYCSNQVSIDTTLKELRGRKNSRFSEVVSRIESNSACQNLSLHSFLMLPMQRVTRLPLLADAVLTKLPSDHDDRCAWEKVLSTLSTVVAQCNEGARIAGRQAEMEALARKLEYASKLTPIPLRDRYLIRSGPVTQLSLKTDSDYKLTFGKKFTKTCLYLFLLTDYLLITKPKLGSHDDTYTVIDTCKRNLIALESVSEDSPWTGRHVMVLTLLENHSGRSTEYVFTCESDTELTRWQDVISPPKSSLIGETLYESWDCPQVMAIYSYAPGQPDELALHPGDVINVLRKMADGWNHGEKLLDGEQGWFPGNYTKEVASEHVRARNLKQRHRLLAVTGNLLQKRSKSNVIY